MPIAVDSSLLNWRDVREELDGQRRQRLGILLGNGASRAIWDNFKYNSLYDMACDPNRPNHLTTQDQRLFKEMKTKNFERVLSALATTKNVCSILNIPFNEIGDSYERIRKGLIQAVRDIHIPYRLVQEEVKSAICRELARHEFVYSTNYDLLLYWSIMQDKDRFKDFFWGKAFDLTDSTPWGDATKVFYLHGALHLYRIPQGQTIKRVGSLGDGGLLDQFDTSGMHVPLFVSEGTSEDKKQAISDNDYLGFAYMSFVRHTGNLVVFGQSLTEEYDWHLIEAMRQWRRIDHQRNIHNLRIIAISIYQNGDDDYVISEKVRLKKALPHYNLRFFDSRTHPLGSVNLRVKPNSD